LSQTQELGKRGRFATVSCRKGIMIGIVIVTHSQLGDALIDAAEFILGTRPDTMVSVSINLNENVDKLRKKIAEGIKKVDHSRGVLILTDMFGGTPVGRHPI